MRKILVVLGALTIPRYRWFAGLKRLRAEILALGTYPMANPAHGIHHIEADDVPSPRQQQEIAQLLEVSTRLHPTKICG
jgi:hypothetical protein